MDPQPPVALQMLWRRWIEVVASFAEHKPDRLRLDPTEYAALHRGLVGACQALAENAGPEHAAWLGSLLQVVQPWISAGSLAQADAELRAELLTRCQAIDREMVRRGWLAPLRRRRWFYALGLLCLFFPPLVVVLMYWGELVLADTVRSGWRSVQLAVRDTGGLGAWFGGAGLLVLTFVLWTVWVLSGPRR